MFSGNVWSIQEADECVSHILVPEGRANVAQKVVRVLERSGGIIDERLRSMHAAERKDLDIKQRTQLCHSLKANGVCQ